MSIDSEHREARRAAWTLAAMAADPETTEAQLVEAFLATSRPSLTAAILAHLVSHVARGCLFAAGATVDMQAVMRGMLGEAIQNDLPPLN